MGVLSQKTRFFTGISAAAVARSLLLGIAGAAMTVAVAVPAAAQTTTASISGQVRDAQGAPVANAVVTARNEGTNQTVTTRSDADGEYTLSGLRPASYAITTDIGGGTVTERVTVEIGQTATLDLTPAVTPAAGEQAAPAGQAGDIVVTGRRLVETRTSEVATNVSRQQIETLPQTDRNFLAFAALAPGVRYNDSETDKSFTSGASTASQVNVFIDGVSLKNKLREGGVAGQQNSRGNPFGQLAVQEFRVLTQNYKAEYEQAGAAIITAITRSGTNDFHGEVFGQYTDKSLTKKSFLDKRNNRPEPDFERKQYGAALGGPIIQDRLFFFAAYEGNDQDRAFNVDSNGTPAAIAEFEQFSGRSIDEFEGAFVSPFRGDFYFGKLTFTPDDRQVFDLSFSRREETDIQGFGGNTSREAAENKVNVVDTYLLKWTYSGDTFVNEVNVNYLDYTFNPTSLNPDLPQFEFVDVITFGGKDSTRREVQKGHTLRNDFTYTGFDSHTLKAGARIEITDIEFNNAAFLQPRFTFRRSTSDNTDFSFPAEARLGLGSGLIRGKNEQFGLYVQDDWRVTDRLELNLGVRWDYETNGFNNNYRTPDRAAAALRSLPTTFYFDPEDYITDGNDRSPFAGAFAPRIGFSYDLRGDRSTVIFGGAGRYYDRNNFNNTVDELSRTINPIGVFRFSRDGADRNGQPTTIFDPSFLTRDGLLNLIASSQTEGLPELFAVKNDAKPPVNDQFSLGVRQRLGQFQAAVTASYQRGRNGYTNLFATRRDEGLGNCCNTDSVRALGYANVLIGFDGLDTRYKAIYFTLDKNYTRASGWGVNVAYTLSKAEQNGNDLFSLDALVPDGYGWRPRNGDERHRLVLSGTKDLPLGFQISTLTTLGSGNAFRVNDATNGFDTGDVQFTASYPEKNCIGGLFAFCEVNVSLTKGFKVFRRDDELEVGVDFLNLFNNKNFAGFDDFINRSENPPNLLDRADIGRDLITLPRRIQFRMGYRF
ncbi:MAG: TonB-dependent receptor [Pseudomonadota bacterium]|nr:TonB-dependent receptor [Pseudomonadota bacterium]